MKDNLVKLLEENDISAYYHTKLINAENENRDILYEYINDKNNPKPFLERGAISTTIGDILPNSSKLGYKNFLINGKEYSFEIVNQEKVSIIDEYSKYVYIREGLVPYEDNPNSQLNYYIKAKNKNQMLKILNEFSSQNENVLVTDPNIHMISQFSFLTGYKNLFNLLTVYFIILTIILVLNSILISANSRVLEFSIYTVYGATKEMISKLMLFEGMLIGLASSISVYIVNIVLVVALSPIILIWFDILTIFIILFIAIIITCGVSAFVMRSIKFKELINFLRSE